MVPRNSPAGIAKRRLALGLLFVFVCATRARAQVEIIDKIGLDRLQITSLGVAYGAIFPSQVEATRVYAVQADYGNLSPTWRVVFGGSYWSSRFRTNVIQSFADSLQKSLANPSDHILPSPVHVYDVTFSGDFRFTPNYSGELKPFFGVGLAAHVINAEGALINGTFIERALDDIAAGFYVTGGVSVHLLPQFGLEGAARADLLSGFRSTQIRGGATYYFGRIHPRGIPSDDGRSSSGSGGTSGSNAGKSTR